MLKKITVIVRYILYVFKSKYTEDHTILNYKLNVLIMCLSEDNKCNLIWNLRITDIYIHRGYLKDKTYYVL